MSTPYWIRHYLNLVVLSGICLLVGCVSKPQAPEHAHDYSASAHASTHQLPPGSNEMLRALISNSNNLEVIISDVIIPPNASVPKHYHPGEEFLYVIEGSAIHREEGKPDLVLKAGDVYVIPPRAAHNPKGGAQGARAIVFRVHDKGQPERVLVEE